MANPAKLGRGSYRFPRAVVFAVSLVVVGAFVLATYLTLDQPKSREFDGYITLLGPVAQEQEAFISVQMRDDGASDDPLVRVSVAICGEGSFSGVLLFGGDAVLDDLAATIPGESVPTTKTYTGELSSAGQSQGNIDEVQSLDVIEAELPPCIPLESGAIWPIALQVEGRFQSAISSTTSILGMTSPRTGYAFPLIGAFPPPTSSALLGIFSLPGDSRDLARPTHLTASVSGPALDIGDVVETSDPVVADPESLGWDAPAPLAASATTLDRDAQAVWLQINAYLGIAFGIAGSVSAAIALDWLAPQREPSPVPQMRRRESSTRSSATGLMAVLGIGIAMLALARVRRARR
ncbi:hypothetical protein [Microbacterium kyungheense]|uniref:Uncharacterized protein n=1 Tax=Microbacterium kyungheense TaxID=1263636 RepID=A0A543EAM7_9MICO|nr:hypothetical protein [Microbacterium kyungheense]TQM18618.1 hypothetical protein FB391_3749 [Microbacterium kyungheense]